MIKLHCYLSIKYKAFRECPLYYLYNRIIINSTVHNSSNTGDFASASGRTTLLYMHLYLHLPGAGLQWGNLHKKPTLEEDYTMIISIVFLVGDSILYMLLAVYLDQLFPGEYGIAKRWYFPFQVSSMKRPKGSQVSGVLVFLIVHSTYLSCYVHMFLMQIFQRSYWCCGNSCRNTNTSYDLNRSRSFDGERTIEYSNCENIEAPESDLKPGIIIKNLTKVR